jgi:DNA-directed RNA polymerase specialized sigma24 family protein
MAKADTGSFAHRFEQTRWTTIEGVSSDDPETAQSSLEAVCKTYWLPLYAFLRRKGQTSEDADELVQLFFEERVLNRTVFEGISRDQRSSFRSWLQACLMNLVRNEWRRKHRLKNGGHSPHIGLEAADAEALYCAESLEGLSAEACFDRLWVSALIQSALEATRQKYLKSGRGDLFEELKNHLPGPQQRRPYREIAERLQKNEEYLRSEVTRLRRCWRDYILREIKRNARSREEAREILKYLMSVLSDSDESH